MPSQAGTRAPSRSGASRLANRQCVPGGLMGSHAGNLSVSNDVERLSSEHPVLSPSDRSIPMCKTRRGGPGWEPTIAGRLATTEFM